MVQKQVSAHERSVPKTKAHVKVCMIKEVFQMIGCEHKQSELLSQPVIPTILEGRN